MSKIISSIKHGASKREGADRTPTRTPTRFITLCPDDAVRLRVEQEGVDWMIRSIDLTVGTLVLGHNGRSA